MNRTLPALASLALVGAAVPTIVPSLANAAATVRSEAAEPGHLSVVARRADDGAWAPFLLDRPAAETPCDLQVAESCGQPLAEAGVFLRFDGGEPVTEHRLQLEQRDDELLLQAVSADGEEVLLVGRARPDADLLAPAVEMNLEPGWEWLREDPAPFMPGRLVLSHSQPDPLLAMAEDPASTSSDSAAPLLARRPQSLGLTPLEAALQGVNRGSSRSDRSTSSPSSRTSLGRSPMADESSPSGVVSLQVIPFRD
jgi:hypothetical protein